MGIQYRLASSICILLLAVFPGKLQASLVIDDLSVALPAPLTTGFFDVIAPTGELTDSATSTLTHSGLLFDTRQVTLTQNSGSAATNNGLFFNINANQGFNISSNGAAGQIVLSYSNADNSSVDFVNNDIKSLTLNSFDLPFGEPLDITVEIEDITTSTASVSQSIANAVSNPLPINFPLNSISGVDLSQVSILTLTFDLPDAGDLNFEDIILIPEPGSMVLLGLGTGLVALPRKRKHA